MLKKICVLLLSVFLFAVYVNAQNVKVVNDLRLRTSIAFEKELRNKLILYSNFELGYEKNITIFEKYHTEIGANYEICKLLDLAVKYRFSKKRKNYSDTFKYTQTYALAIQFNKKIDRFKLSYRLQYQNIDDEINWLSSHEADNILRNRVKIKYNIRGMKIDPFISTEIYNPFNINEIYASKIKTLIGAEIDLNKWGELKPYYRLDNEISIIEPYMYYTIGCDYIFKF